MMCGFILPEQNSWFK